MGDSEGDANEAPRAATVKPFRLMRHKVTNRQFDAFAAGTNHLTDADSYFPGCPERVNSGRSDAFEPRSVIRRKTDISR